MAWRHCRLALPPLHPETARPPLQTDSIPWPVPIPSSSVRAAAAFSPNGLAAATAAVTGTRSSRKRQGRPRLWVGGDPGIGKSTLLLQAVAGLARKGIRTAYVSGEESTGQVRRRAKRLGLADAPVQLAGETALTNILDGLKAEKPDVVVIDSIQTMWSDQLAAAPGTVAQVRACAQELTRYAKKTGACVLLVGHVTKDGQIAGPRVVEHMVDAVLYFEGEQPPVPHSARRKEPFRPDRRDRRF